MIKFPTEDEPVKVVEGGCCEILKTLPEESFDSVVTDPPYEIGFMGKAWDTSGVAFDPKTWEAVLRVLKPGAYLLEFGGTRTYHRLTCAIEDAEFEIRDCLMWVYGTGFPKGAGCLKPAWEPIVLARKPGAKVLPLGVEGCRVPCDGPNPSIERRKGKPAGRPGEYGSTIVNRITPERYAEERPGESLGRYPANVLHDGSGEVLEAFAAFGETSPSRAGTRKRSSTRAQDGHGKAEGYRLNAGEMVEYGDTGTAARFFYCAKASRKEREGNPHPTVKPLALMRWLVRLVTPLGGLVLDPFCGSGTTGIAAALESMRCLIIESNPAYAQICRERIANVLSAGIFDAPPSETNSTKSMSDDVCVD